MTTDCQVTPSVATDFLVAGLDIVGTVGMTYRIDTLGCTESETPWTGRSETCPTPGQDEDCCNSSAVRWTNSQAWRTWGASVLVCPTHSRKVYRPFKTVCVR